MPIANLFGTPSNPITPVSATPAPEGDPKPKPEGDPAPEPKSKPAPEGIPQDINSLDPFNFLVDNGSTGEGDQVPTPIDIDKLLTPDALSKVAESIDFSSNITPEVMEAFKSGDPKAQMQVMQQMNQAAYVQAMIHSNALSSRALQTSSDAHASQLNSSIDNAISNKQVQNAIPGSDNPIVAMGIDSISASISAKYPKATSTQVATMTKQFFNQMNSAMNPNAAPPSPESQGVVDDWGDFAGDN